MGTHDFTHLQTWTDPPRRCLTTVVKPHLLGARGKSPETYRYEGLPPGDKGYCCNMWFHFKAAAGWSRNLMYWPTMSRFKPTNLVSIELTLLKGDERRQMASELRRRLKWTVNYNPTQEKPSPGPALTWLLWMEMAQASLSGSCCRLRWIPPPDLNTQRSCFSTSVTPHRKRTRGSPEDAGSESENIDAAMPRCHQIFWNHFNELWR